MHLTNRVEDSLRVAVSESSCDRYLLATVSFLDWTCVEIKFRAPYAVDGTLSPWQRRLDGVKAHEGLRNNSQDNRTH